MATAIDRMHTGTRVYRVELRYRDADFDGEGRRLTAVLREYGLSAPARVESRPQYLLQADALDAATVERLAAELLAEPLTQTWHVASASEPMPAEPDSVERVVRRKPGVMDPTEAAVLRGGRDLGIALQTAATATKYVFHGLPERVPDGRGRDEWLREVARRYLANELIEDVTPGDEAVATLATGSRYTLQRVEVPSFVDCDDEGLLALSRSHGLALDIHEMRAIQAHYRARGRIPTDVELETLAQTWSEHCKHKTLTGRIEFTARDAAGNVREQHTVDNPLKSTIARATHEIMQARPGFCLSVFVDNAGVIAFDERWGVAMKVETHNHPSALEPYGGAGTGVGGVIRDILGTGLGAKPILNTDVFCFGPLELDAAAVPQGVLHPKRVMRGVIAGVRDYGNRMGIPTANGAVFFHERYLGNPLVYCGCVGLIPRDKLEKRAEPGDVIVTAGGKTGRDGIGGATFSSVELTSESETVSSGAVQIGNAIEEKRVLDALLQARDRGLYRNVTDCGAGGLSSAVGEMAEAIGADVELDRVPLKYAGLSYREIWLSEAQERMVLAVPSESLDELLALFAEEDVLATPIGRFVDERVLRLRYDGEVVAEMDMHFLHHGLPRTPRQAEWREPQPVAAPALARPDGEYTPDVLAILGLPNVCSKEAIVRQYDHEVQGMSVVKPFVGVRQDGPADAAVLRPFADSRRGIVVSNGLNPELGLIDPYHMTANAIDEAVRNALAAGGTRHHLAILDNFSWGNCAKPDRLGGVIRACDACYDVATAYGTPFISGKDSLNNEYVTADGEAIAIPPTLLVSAVGIVEDVERDALTSDFKQAGSVLALLGITRPEFGGSHLRLARGTAAGTDVPRVRPAEAVAVFDLFEALRQAGLLLAAHDCAEGGLAVALAEMAIGGDLGADVVLAEVAVADAEGLEAHEREVAVLFAESPSRFVVELPAAAWERAVTLAHQTAQTAGGLTHPLLQRLGTVTAANRLALHGHHARAEARVAELREAWQAPLRQPMHG